MSVPMRPFTFADALRRARPAAQDDTAVGIQHPRALSRFGTGVLADQLDNVLSPTPKTPAVIEPRGGDFPSAYRFELNQEVPAGAYRRHPGRILQEGDFGNAGLDPIAFQEVERLHPGWTESAMPAGIPGEAVDAPASYGPRATPVAKARNANVARSVYADIWNESGAGTLPEPLATIHYDAAVQHGPAVALQLLRQSGGDPATYVDLREARYRADMTAPNANSPRGYFREKPANQRGWVEQRIPALRKIARRR